MACRVAGLYSLQIPDKKLFNQKIAALNVTSQSAFIKRYNIVWSLTALVWGIAGWLSFANLPIQNLYICASILNLVGFIGVLNLTYHKQIVKHFVNVLMGTQVIAVVLHISFVDKFQGPSLQYVH